MKKNMSRTIKSLMDYRTELLREMESLDHVLECSLENYDFMIDFAIKEGFEQVVDIGCAYGHQAELCRGRIKYIGIDKDAVDFYDYGEHYDKKYPCWIYERKFKNDLAIANLSIGWNCYNNEEEFDEICKHLVKDFKACLLYIPMERKEILLRNFKDVEAIKEDDKLISTGFYYCHD